jgi:hypothetical protein
MNRIDRTFIICLGLLGFAPAQTALVASYAHAQGTPVTQENFIVAETDRYFSEHVAKHPVNTIRHAREPSGPDNQFVITENQDVLYSHALVDTSGGATITNPAWDYFSVIQIIDENEYTIDVLYPGQSRKLTPKDLTMGTYVFLNMRTGIPSLDAAGLAAAHKHQDAFGIEAASATPYKSKGFDKASLDATRAALIARAGEVKEVYKAFGMPKDTDPTTRLIAAAAGWGGLPVKDAAYISTIRPDKAAADGACAAMTLPRPPLQFDKGGFFSVTTYGPDSWIKTKNFALSNRQAKANADGSVTFRYNCPGEPNNIDTVKGWIQVIRLYQAVGTDQIIAYVNDIQAKVNVETK